MAVGTAWIRNRERLADLIDRSGLSERAVARTVSLSHSTVNHLVSGRRTSCSVTTAHAIAHVLGVDAKRLFFL